MGLLLYVGVVMPLEAFAQQYVVADDFKVAWTLDPRDHPDLFDHGPAFGARGVLAGMDFDGDGHKEILFSTDETLAPQGPDPGQLDVFLFENTGDDAYEHVWHFTHEPSNSLPPLGYGDLDEDGQWEIYMGVPTINDAADDLLIFEQDVDGVFPEEPTLTYGYERDGSLDFRPSGFVVGDFDGDGIRELATTSRTSSARELVIIEPTAGIDAFATFTIEFELGNQVLGGGGVYDVDAVDFDRDGSMEVWVNTWDNFSWAIVEATGEDSYALQAEINGAYPDGDPGSFNVSKLLFHDADGDDRLELLAPMTNGVLYYLEDTDDVSTVSGNSFVAVGTFAAGSDHRGADLGDIDGDGLFDLVMANGRGETVTRAEYDGSGNLADSTSYAWSTILDSSGDSAQERYYPLRIADDLDGDGTNELVLTNLFASDAGQHVLIVLESTALSSDLEDAPTSELPERVALRQNYPNPFNPTTVIEYEINESAPVSLRVFDNLGSLVTTLVDGVVQSPGVYQVGWDGRSDSGRPMASGVYIYTLETRGFREARQMVLVK